MKIVQDYNLTYIEDNSLIDYLKFRKNCLSNSEEIEEPHLYILGSEEKNAVIARGKYPESQIRKLGEDTIFLSYYAPNFNIKKYDDLILTPRNNLILSSWIPYSFTKKILLCSLFDALKKSYKNLDIKLRKNNFIISGKKFCIEDEILTKSGVWTDIYLNINFNENKYFFEKYLDKEALEDITSLQDELKSFNQKKIINALIRNFKEFSLE